MMTSLEKNGLVLKRPQEPSSPNLLPLPWAALEGILRRTAEVICLVQLGEEMAEE